MSTEKGNRREREVSVGEASNGQAENQTRIPEPLFSFPNHEKHRHRTSYHVPKEGLACDFKYAHLKNTLGMRQRTLSW